MTPTDRKALLLARSALERQALTLELMELKEAATPAHLVRSVFGQGRLGQFLVGRTQRSSRGSGGGESHGLLHGALDLVQRYPVLTTVISGLMPLLRRSRRRRDADDDDVAGRRGRRRRRGGFKLKLMLLGVLAGAGWALYQKLR